MKTNDFNQLMEATFDNIRTLSNTKGKEYSVDDDRLSNFKTDSATLGVTPLQSLAIFLRKHLNSIWHYVRNEEVLSEPIDERINDAILYLILLKALIKERQPLKHFHTEILSELKELLNPEREALIKERQQEGKKTTWIGECGPIPIPKVFGLKK